MRWVVALLLLAWCAPAEAQHLRPIAPMQWGCPGGQCRPGFGAGVGFEIYGGRPRATPPAPSNLYGQAPTYVARVRVGDSDGSMSGGTGVLIDSQQTGALVLTNNHVIRDRATNESITVSLPDGSNSTGRVIMTDATWDIAAIEINPTSAKPIALAASNPQPGERLTAAGFGPRGEYQAVPGSCIGYNGPSASSQREWVVMSGGVRQGDSGGPIVNSRGELAGILFGTTGTEICGPCCGCLRRFLSRIQRRNDGVAVTDPQPTPTPPNVDLGTSGPVTSTPDIAALVAKIDALAAKVDSLALMPGVPGPRGPPGEQGPPGKDAELPSVGELQGLLDAYLAARPITVRVVDADGNEVSEPGRVTLGGVLTLRLTPKVKAQ